MPLQFITNNSNTSQQFPEDLNPYFFCRKKVMDLISKILLYLHIAAGTIALITGPVAMFNQNGNRMHRLSGKGFFYCMSIVFITAVYLSIVDKIPFLLMIAVFSYYNIAVAYRALYLKKLNSRYRAQKIDWLITVFAGCFNAGLLCWGVCRMFTENQSFGLVAVLFGGFGLYTAYRNIVIYIHGYRIRNGWLYIHISGMIAGYIAAFTAFLVNAIKFTPPFVLWLAPSALFVPVIFITIRKFKKKLLVSEINQLAEIKIKN
jgi:uncharacterized membrane protein